MQHPGEAHMVGIGIVLSGIAAVRGRRRPGPSWRPACACALGGLLLVAGSAGLLGAAVPVPGHGGGVETPYEGYPADDAVGPQGIGLSDCVATGTAPVPVVRRGEPDGLLDTLRHSPTARHLLREAARRGVRVCLDGATELLAYYYADRKTVGVSTALTEGARIVFLAHELAHVPQHPAFSDDRRLAPRDLVLLRRLREAAAEAVATRVAWELRQAGFDAAWREKRRSAYRDVAEAFAESLAGQDGGAAEALTGATRAAFDQWFRAAWRLRVYDRMTLAHLVRVAREDWGPVPVRRVLDDAFLRRIGQIGGTQFLAGADRKPLTDPFYAGRLLPRDAAAIARFLEATHRGAGTPDAGLVSGALS